VVTSYAGTAMCSGPLTSPTGHAHLVLNPVSDESLDPDDHTVRICSPELFITSSLETNRLLSDFFSQLIQTTTQKL